MAGTGVGLGRAARWRPYLPWIVAAAFSVSGCVHVVRPGTFTGIVPSFLPWHTAIVEVSGVAELVVAAGLWRRSWWAGPAAAALLVAIFPANVQEAVSSDTWVYWVRLPLQVPLIWFALQAPHRAGHGARPHPRPGAARS